MKKKITTKKKAASKRLTGGESVWLQRQFDQIDRQLILILARIKELHTEIIGEGNVIEELEQAVNRVDTRARAIDRKVKDE
jgi:hypothetical protein